VVEPHLRQNYLLVDDLNKVFIVLTTFAASRQRLQRELHRP